MTEWLLNRVPWYSASLEAQRENRVRMAHHRAISVRISADRVYTDYIKAEARRTARRFR